MSVSAGDIVSPGENAPDGASEALVGALTLKGLGYALLTIALIVAVQRIFKGFIATISVLIGLVAATGAAAALGDVDFSGVAAAAPLGVTTPFYFGVPQLSAAGIASMVIVMAVTAVETTGDVFATGEVVGRRITPGHIAAALRADGLSTLLGGILNSFPYTCFAQNVGLVRLTRVRSRWVVTAAGAMMIVLGLVPKAGAVVAAIPSPVIGGASLAMFASVAVVGIQTLGKVDMKDNRNAVIVLDLDRAGAAGDLQAGHRRRHARLAADHLRLGRDDRCAERRDPQPALLPRGPPGGADVAVVAGRAVSLEEVGAMEREQFVQTFSRLYVGAAWPAERVWESRPFASTTALRQAFEDEVLAAGREEQEALVRGYTDVVDLLLSDAGDERARLETASLALGGFDDAEAAELRALGEAYREKFDRPLVMCVARIADRGQLIARGWARVHSSPAREARAALGEVIDIADERFDAMIADANPIRTAWARKFEQLD